MDKNVSESVNIKSHSLSSSRIVGAAFLQSLSICIATVTADLPHLLFALQFGGKSVIPWICKGPEILFIFRLPKLKHFATIEEIKIVSCYCRYQREKISNQYRYGCPKINTEYLTPSFTQTVPYYLYI